MSEFIPPPPPVLDSRSTKPRFMSPRTPIEIIDELVGKTELIQHQLAERHIGSWMAVGGGIENISHRRPDEPVRVSIRNRDDQVVLFLEFDPEAWLPILRQYNKGDLVEVLGQIARINVFSRHEAFISLTQCELQE